MSALNRNHEVDVRNTYRIGNNIDNFCDFDNVTSKVFSEHGPDLDFLLPGVGAEPLTYLLREHNEYLSLVPVLTNFVYRDCASRTGQYVWLALEFELTV